MTEGVDLGEIKGNNLIKINGILVTHFTSGDGTKEQPYEPMGGTMLSEALLDGFNGALYNKDKTVFFKFGGQTVRVNQDMRARTMGETDPNFQKMLSDEAEKLRKEGHRVLTPPEIEKMNQDFAKSASKKPGIIDKVFEKFGL